MADTETDFEDIKTDSDAFNLPFNVEDEGLFDHYETYQDLFKYRTEDFISRAKFSKYCDIEENILEFDFSYGYDCRRPFNLVLADEHTLIFSSGNIIHFFDVETREMWFRRSALGGGIGHITKNPNIEWPHIAVGEIGPNPPIIIYEWPSMDIVTVLKGGTTHVFTHLNYNPSGVLLASQGSEPDYLITIWNWRKSTILLRSKSYVNDVSRVMFSPEVPGQLTSCGCAHIKFWKMCNTFTGLKLKGELGRFGKTEYSDILGIYPMADEKVISGCYWGNILVWEEGLIKVEVCRRNRKRCHDEPIVQFDYKNGELWTVSMDGHVRVWFYDTIDQADPPDEDRFVQMEPTYDFYTPGARYISIVKQNIDPDDIFYFAQDGNGAIWRIELSTEIECKPSERILKCHAGITVGLGVCPWGPYFTTLGIGGWVHLYNYEERKLLVFYLAPARGVALIWTPMQIDPSGEVVMLAFNDGTVRVAAWKVNINEPTLSKLVTIQVEKSHNKSLICIDFNPPGTIFVSSGEDSTLFVFKVLKEPLEYLKLIRIGYINTPANVTCISWHNENDATIIAGCELGYIVIAELPTEPVDYTKITYILKIEPTIMRFKSYKSQIRRNDYLREEAARKAKKREDKMEELQKIRKENPGMDIEDELFLADSESEEKLPPLYIPKVQNKIIFIQHTPDNTLWLSIDGYDAGYIYEYKMDQKEEIPYKFTLIEGAEDVAINKYCYTRKRDFIIFAMENGAIRVNRINKNNWHDLSNHWVLTMHDSLNGHISGMGFTYDESYFICTGRDGSVFTFRFNPEGSIDGSEPVIIRQVPSEINQVDVGPCHDMLSIEETIVKAELDRINAVANAHKEEYLLKIQTLREQFELIEMRNLELPLSQQISPEDLTVDRRVVSNLQEKLDADLALVKHKFAFNVEKSEIHMMKLRKHFIDCMDVFPLVVNGIEEPCQLSCIKQRKLEEHFDKILAMVDEQILESELKGRPPERAPPPPVKVMQIKKPEKKLEFFLVGLSPQVIKNQLGPRINITLSKYRKRKEKREERAREWEVFNALRPNDAPTEADDDAIVREASMSIGDFKLKTAIDYKVPRELRETTFKKYKELLLVRKKQYDLVHDYNLKVYNFREKKKNLHEKITKDTKLLIKVQEELKPDDCKPIPPTFEFGEDNYPDKRLIINVAMPNAEEIVVEETANIIPPPTKDLLRREVLERLPELEKEEEETESQWERELRRHHYTRKLNQQDIILIQMQSAITNFDDELKVTQLKQIELFVDYYFITLHLFTLNQELMILKECENKEDTLSDKVNSKIQNLLDIQDVLTFITNEIESKKKEIEKLQEKEKELQRSFWVATGDNKFYDFLRKIFKKKFRPPKVHTDDDSESDSSSSSSEESEDEDAGSIDSKDFGIIRLDENVCPKGCDQGLYDLTFNLRSQRHAIEAETRDLNFNIEILKKNYESTMKRCRVIDNTLKESMEDLEAYQREKQKRLNQISCTIILPLDRIQNLNKEQNLNLIKDSIVIHKSTLSGLYRRVGELNEDTAQQKAKHKLSLTHIQRMKADFKCMTKDIAKLKKKIQEERRIKFGGPCKLDEIEEFVLKKMIYDLKLSMLNIQSMFTGELEIWNQKYKETQIEIMKMYKKNSHKWELVTLLNREKQELGTTIGRQENIKDCMDTLIDKAEQIRHEIQKLDAVLQKQNKEIEILKTEIQKYKTKGFTLKTERQVNIEEEATEHESEEDSIVTLWDDLDDYMYTESYAKEYWKHREVEEVRKTRQEMIMIIMNDLFKSIKVEVEKNNVVRLIKKVISDVMNKCDVEQIISDLIEAIPIRCDNDNSLIELTAEKLCSLDEFEGEEEEEEEMSYTSNEILIGIVDDVLGSKLEGDDDSIIFINLIPKLIENLPLDAIMDANNIKVIADRLKMSINIGDEELIDRITADVQMKTLEARLVLTEILDRICESDTE